MNPKFIAKHNPLESYFELNEDQKIAFKYAVRAELLEEAARFARHFLKRETPETALAIRELGEFCLDNLAEDVEREYKYSLDQLTWEHMGDCTCYPASCCKCHAESLLDLKSTPGLTKRMGYNLTTAYCKDTTIDEALEKLKSFRGKNVAELEETISWLEEYKQKYI